MATTYKTFLDDDIVSTKTLLHENIPITGTVISSSTYGVNNIKTFAHGMFSSVYDYPYLSSSANHLFDITIGLAGSGSPGSNSLGTDSFVNKKVNTYNQTAQVLVGFDSTGSILKYDRDGDQATADTAEKFNSVFILNFSRLLVKDEIKKGSFQLTLGVNSSSAVPFNATCLISDASASSGGGYKTNSPTGEYGVLYASNFAAVGGAASAYGANIDNEVGLIYYQAGVAVLSTAIFALSGTNSVLASINQNQQGQLATHTVALMGTSSIYTNLNNLFGSGSMNDAGAALRNRIQNLTFNNTTELNSTIHFCRVNHNDFNYSSNPTYLSQSQIRVKNKTTDAPVSYITTVGLYSPDNELLAVAKLSEPLKKDPTQELILRVRLDY